MGKLKIQGTAVKTYSYDEITLTVGFHTQAENSAAAMAEVLRECENFLSEVKKIGIDLKDVHLSDDRMNQDYDEGPSGEALREIELRLPFDLKLINTIFTIISEHHYHAELDTAYGLSKQHEIRNELIRMAIEDSRAKALCIAETVGQKITGIDSVEISSDGCRADMAWKGDLKSIVCPASTSLTDSNAISPAVIEETETVDVVWLMA